LVRRLHFTIHARQPAEGRLCVQAGFTLIELLVVFTLLALLLTLATPKYLKTLESGKSKVQAQNMATLRDAIDKFRADQGRYPAQLEEIVAKQYLRQIPVDPVSGTHGWLAVPSPNTEETGIYDVRPPELVSASAPPAANADNTPNAVQAVAPSPTANPGPASTP
jgi:general secretion pathway protein G